MGDHVRWGILGASRFALNQMAPALHLAGRGALCALGTPSQTKAGAFRDMVPGLRVHDSYQGVLEDPDIDAVYIPLPNHTHVEWSKRAIEAGKHVLCEKPMTLQAREFDELITLRDRSGLVVAEAYMIVHHPQWQRARDMVRDGAIGALRHVQGHFSFMNTDPADIRNNAGTGGGGIRDIGVYTYGATRFVSGQEPDEITHADIRWDNGVDVFASVSARFDGFTAQWVNSMRLHPFQEMNFHGTKGVIRLTAPFNPMDHGEARIELHQPDKGVRVERFPADRQYVLQVEAFNAAVLDRAAYPCPLEFSQGTQAVIDAVFAAGGAA